MKALLSTAIYRKITLLEFLDNFSTWCPTKDVTSFLNCSAKTLLSDIDYINEFWGEYVYVEYSKYQGVRLNNLSSNKMANVYSTIFQECDEFQFIEKLLHTPNEDADYWINELFMSEASFYRMVNAVEAFLEKRGLVLERGPFCITAPDERWVRFFYQQYYTEAYGINDWPFDVDQKGTFCYVMRASTDFDVSLDDREIQNASFLLMVTLIRMNQGFTLSDKLYKESDDTIDKVIEYSEEIVASLLEGSSYSLTRKWYKEVARTVFHEFYSWDNEQQVIRIHKKVNNFLDKLTRAVEFPLLEEDRNKITQQMMSWYVQYNFYPFKRIILYDKQRKFAHEVHHMYPVFSTLVTLYLEDIDKRNPTLWINVRLYDIMALLMKEWSQLPIQLEKMRKQVSVILVSNLGKKHAEMMRDFLYAQYGDKLKLDVFESTVLFSGPDDFEILDDYDLVVSNNPIDDYQKDNCLIVNNFISASDCDTLEEYISQIQQKSSLDFIRDIGYSYLRRAKQIYSYPYMPAQKALN